MLLDICNLPFNFITFNFFSVYSNELSIPLGEGECLEVPKVAKQQSLYDVWSSDDCVLSNCECYNTSTFQPEIKLNSSSFTPDDTAYSLCWSNLITDRNSKMFFFYEELSRSENDMSPFLSRKYDETAFSFSEVCNAVYDVLEQNNAICPCRSSFGCYTR